MNKLYIAGDSFATLSKDQAIGDSWSELLATKYDLELVNISRCASSNFLIALQIDWISHRVTENDYVIVFLTDHYRKALIDNALEKVPKDHILEYQSAYINQRPNKHLNYNSEPRLIASIIHHKGKTKQYYVDWFDIDLQKIEDRLVITGALCALQKKTKKFLVLTGGYADDPTNETFCIPQYNFVNLSITTLGAWSDTEVSKERSNHMDDLTHKKIVVYLKKYINNLPS